MDDPTPALDTPTVPETVGERLRADRERLGLSLSEVAARTRVPLRHLEAIEAGNYDGLPTATYATGFARAYARTVGADEVEVARGVREELAGVTRPVRQYQPYEPTDPARVPSRTVVIVALGVAIAVLLLAALYFGSGLLRGGGTGQPAAPVAAPVAQTPVAPAPTPAVASGGQVLITATDEVWLRIYDAAGKTIHQGTLKQGEHFEVPGDAKDPMINVGRPDKISITLNGSQLSGLNLGDTPIKDVRVSADALRARTSGATATPSPAPGNAQ